MRALQEADPQRQGAHGGAGAEGGMGVGVSQGQSLRVGRRTVLERTVVAAAQQCDCP